MIQPTALLLLLLLVPLQATPGALATSQGSPPVAPARDPARLRTEAADLAAKGELTRARAGWLAAAELLPVGEERDECVALARTLDARLVLRTEIVAAFPNDQRVFGEIGFEKVDEAGVTVAGKRVAWNDLGLDLLRRAGAASRPSKSAAAGLVHEALARGTAAEKREALNDLARLLERHEIEAVDAWSAVARTRGERVPARGYAFRDGDWKSIDALAEKAAASGLEDLGRKLELAQPAQRDALVASLEALGSEGVPRLSKALEVRWSDAMRGLARGATLNALQQLAQARRDLDLRRKAALDLIFDTEKYFYPYNPPECPPEKVKLYAPVQQKVDELVSSVRDAWKSTRRVSLPQAFRATLDEVAWSRAQQKERKLEFTLASDVPAWIEALDRAAETVDLRTFAWDAKERKALERDAQVVNLNKRFWQRKETDPARAADSEEQAQVEITNDYRRMFGRCVLAWNPKIQAAAQGHSDFMSLTGEFGHYEPDPKRKTPADRLRLAGYKFGGSENCHMGDSGAEGAHVGWTHSSGHHRNLLEMRHREMASASSGNYWTQNFGSGNEFESELPAGKP